MATRLVEEDVVQRRLMDLQVCDAKTLVVEGADDVREMLAVSLLKTL